MTQHKKATRTRQPAKPSGRPRFYLIPRVRVSVVREGWIRTRQHPYIGSNVALAAALASCFPEDEAREHFVMAILDVRHRLLGLHTVSIGCVTGTLVHPRDVLRSAILAGGSSIGLAHNHCSGNPEPSIEDVALTRRIQRCAELMGIRLLDHVVFGAGMRWVSLRQRGYIVDPEQRAKRRVKPKRPARATRQARANSSAAES